MTSPNRQTRTLVRIQRAADVSPPVRSKDPGARSRPYDDVAAKEQHTPFAQIQRAASVSWRVRRRESGKQSRAVRSRRPGTGFWHARFCAQAPDSPAQSDDRCQPVPSGPGRSVVAKTTATMSPLRPPQRNGQSSSHGTFSIASCRPSISSSFAPSGSFSWPLHPVAKYE